MIWLPYLVSARKLQFILSSKLVMVRWPILNFPIGILSNLSYDYEIQKCPTQPTHPTHPDPPTCKKTSIRFFPLGLIGSNLISPLCQITDGCHRLCFRVIGQSEVFLNNVQTFFCVKKCLNVKCVYRFFFLALFGI